MLQVADVPLQRNSIDCGIYMLAFVDFFATQAPQYVHHAPNGTVVTWFGDARENQPTFLTAGWFPDDHCELMRHQLMLELLQRMRDDALCPAKMHQLSRQLQFSAMLTRLTLARLGKRKCAPNPLPHLGQALSALNLRSRRHMT